MSAFPNLRIESKGPLVNGTKIFLDGQEVKLITSASLDFTAGELVTLLVKSIVAPDGGSITVENVLVSFEHMNLPREAEYQLYLHLRRKLGFEPVGV